MSFNLHTLRSWRAGHYEYKMSDRETFELPLNNPPARLVATNTALPKGPFSTGKRLLSPIQSHKDKVLQKDKNESQDRIKRRLKGIHP